MSSMSEYRFCRHESHRVGTHGVIELACSAWFFAAHHLFR